MTFKINIGDSSGETYKLELETEELNEKSLHDKIQGKDLKPELEGYEFEISGTSDKSGFTSMKGAPGIGLKKVLLTYGKGMKRRPRLEGKKKRSDSTPKGLRLRKTVRGQIISSEITQINLKILKEGAKKLAEIFPDQNKAKEEPAKEQETSTEQPKEKPAEQKPKPAKEEKSVNDTPTKNVKVNNNNPSSEETKE